MNLLPNNLRAELPFGASKGATSPAMGADTDRFVSGFEMTGDGGRLSFFFLTKSFLPHAGDRDGEFGKLAVVDSTGRRLARASTSTSSPTLCKEIDDFVATSEAFEGFGTVPNRIGRRTFCQCQCHGLSSSKRS